jgi:uncharacterized membrane protein YhaH (DUF805 family)
MIKNVAEGLMSWYWQVWKKYAVFSGRANRREFWIFTIVSDLFIAALVAIAGFNNTEPRIFVPCLVIGGAYLLASFIPSLAVMVRRLHDTGHSGAYMLVQLIPFIGGFLLVGYLLQQGDQGVNQFDPGPTNELSV